MHNPPFFFYCLKLKYAHIIVVGLVLIGIIIQNILSDEIE